MHLPTRIRKGLKAFTLIELLTVIAIIGVLSGILIPTVSSAMSSAKKAKGRAQMRQYATGLLQYQSHYNFWPSIGTLGDGQEIRLDNGDYSENFIMAMTGRTYNGNDLSATERQYNPQAIAFMSFSDQEFYSDPYTGRLNYRQLADPYGNRRIRMQVEHDYPGVISLSTPIRQQSNRASQDYDQVRAKAVVFTLYDSAQADSREFNYETLLSWE